MTQIAAIPACIESTAGVKSARSPMQTGRRRLDHYQVGPVSVSVRSDLAEIETIFAKQYARYRTGTSVPSDFHIDVVARRSPRSWRRYYHILGNGEELFVVRRERSVLPHVEWAINILVLNYLPGYLQIHASVMSRDGVGLICPGTPGQGKTTLAAGLLSRGWSYFSDEFALIDPDTRLLTAYAKPLCVKAGSFDELERLGLPLSDGPAYLKGDKGPVRFIDPLRVRPDAIADPCRVGLIVFPEYRPDEPPAVEPMPRAQAVFELARVSFNFHKLRARGFDLLADIAAGARSYRIRSGDLTTTCRLVEDCLRQSPETEA